MLDNRQKNMMIMSAVQCLRIAHDADLLGPVVAELIAHGRHDVVTELSAVLDDAAVGGGL